MTHRTSISVALLVCSYFGLVNTGLSNSAYADQNNTKEQNVTQNRIHGKVTEIINAVGYTYTEVDTGKKKVWAAGPHTQLKIGDTVAFSAGMPMENFHSKSMKRDFSILYFVNRFISEKETQTTNTVANASSHGQIKQEPVVKSVIDINKVDGGNTIAEIYTDKNKLKGKTIRVRGQVTKFSANIMGKNWLHIRDSSTSGDLTVTTNSRVAIADIVVIEGKLELDKDFGYGYVYPVILEDAKITKE